jgi:magnesium-protoporphyrin O-methyltransferase
MASDTYLSRRGELCTYFDRTALEAWERLTSTAPVGRIRTAVRAGRNEMRATLLDWLPRNLAGRRLLDAGCGTGALTASAARRGAATCGVEIAPKLIEIARTRLQRERFEERPEFVVGDMLDAKLGEFDYVVAMDSLIHYGEGDVVDMLAQLAARTRVAVLFTFAPRTPLLAALHRLGRLLPRANRAPAIEPLREASLRERLTTDPRLLGWRLARSQRVATRFYCSQAVELIRG